MNRDKETKIAIITHNFPENIYERNNAGIFIYELAEEIKKKINLIVLSVGNKSEVTKVGNIPVWFFSKNSEKKLGDLKVWNPLDLYKLIKFFVDGEKYLKKFVDSVGKVNLSLAMWAFPSGYFAYRLKKQYGIPYVIWSLGSDINIYAKIPLLRRLIIKILQEAECLFADGIELAKDVEKISGKECIFLPSATKMPIRQISKPMKNQHNKKIKLTFLGRMELVKGPDIFLESLIKVKDFKDQFEVHFIGDGNLLSVLKEKAKNNNLSNVTFHGNISDKIEINKVLKGSDWLIIPSRNDSIPLVFSEAMKSGVPIISSSLTDISFLISKYKVGYIFKTEDSNSLANLLQTLPARTKERVLFIKNTQKAADFFRLASISENLLKILKQKKII